LDKQEKVTRSPAGERNALPRKQKTEAKWIPASAGMTNVRRWIPASAGMTNAAMDFRFRGNDGYGARVPAFAAMTS
jgi:hypothetical protein